MNFRPRRLEEPEINLIAFIDVLLVVLIFLMLSTTYNKFTEIQLQLPVADTEAQKDYPAEIQVTVGSDGSYGVNGQGLLGRGPDGLAAAMQTAAKGPQTVVVINADAAARHQAVITVMEAARRVGLSQITFATQSSAQAGAR